MNLCTLAQVKAYIGATDTNQDTLISALIGPASNMALQFLQRRLQRGVHTNVRFNGRGTASMQLSDTPILSVEGLMVDGVTIAESTDGIRSGYMFDDDTIYLVGGYCFSRGLQNVVLSWTAGLNTTESDFIPDAPGPYTVSPVVGSGLGPDGNPAFTNGWAAVDHGVIYTASGVALTLVGGVPATGQYAFSGGTYTYAAADKLLEVTENYDYVPEDIKQAVIELVFLKVRQRSNIGVRSRSMPGESVQFEERDMSPAVRGMLQPWRRMVPIGP